MEKIPLRPHAGFIRLRILRKSISKFGEVPTSKRQSRFRNLVIRIQQPLGMLEEGLNDAGSTVRTHLHARVQYKAAVLICLLLGPVGKEILREHIMWLSFRLYTLCNWKYYGYGLEAALEGIETTVSIPASSSSTEKSTDIFQQLQLPEIRHRYHSTTLYIGQSSEALRYNFV